MRSPVVIAGILNVLIIFAASLYAILAILGKVDVNITIFLVWLIALNFFNGLFIYLLWRQRKFFDYIHQALVLLWGGVSIWYWSFAPIYYLLNMNLDARQMAWTMFAYFWEVPVIGGLVFVTSAYLLFKPINDYFKGQLKISDPGEFYKKILRYPVWLACLMYVIALVGYAIGTLQLKYFADLSYTEQIKNTLNGLAVSIFIIIIFYLLFSQFLSRVRAKVENEHKSYVFPKTKFLNKTILISSLVVVGVLALLSLIVFRSFQDSVLESTKIRLNASIIGLKQSLSSAGSAEEMDEILSRFSFRSGDDAVLLQAGQGLDEDGFSAETIAFLNSKGEGYVNDFRKENKLVGFWKGPASVGTLVVVVPMAPIYAKTSPAVYKFFLSSSLVLLLTIPLVVFISFATTRSMVILISYLHSRRFEYIDQETRLYTGDEMEELSHTVASYATKVMESQKQLENKVEEATAELRAKIAETEQYTEYLEKTKTAALNLLEDLDTTKARLEEGKLKDEAILSSIGDGMVVVDQDENVVLVNKRVEDMLGFTSEELLGKKWYDIVLLQTEGGVPLIVGDRPIKQAFMTQKRISVLPLITPSKTYFFVRKDKTRFPVEIVASPIILNGKLLGAVEVFRDITREKEIERVKTEFVSIASHQLRTPLSTINWYSEILLAGDSGPLTKDQREYLDEIYRGNQRMIDLVNALLNVSRLEVGAFIVEAKPIDLSAVAKDVLNEVKPQIMNKHITLKENYSKDLPMVDADYSLARIIFQNLITNAVKYTPPNGMVEVEITSKDKESIEIKVSDNGIGIPKQQQEKIFTKLFRADNARETDPDGTGLGLYIIRSIIDQTNGKIWFESEEGKGTAFFISVPVHWMNSKTGTRKLV